MSTITTLDDNLVVSAANPGAQLASVREQKGYSIEYVANKLKLRARVIELLELNDFNSLPGPVFVKGYLRAYARLLDISPDPYLAVFDNQHVAEKKPERAALWQQTKRETNKVEHAIRWFTILFAIGAVIAVGIWWQKNNEGQQQAISENETKITDLSLNQETTTEVKLTDLSEMQTLLNPKMEMSTLEKTGD